MKKPLSYFLILVMLLGSGCHSLRKKFIRKKKHEEAPPVYIGVKDYPSKLTQEAYIDYNLFVRGWLEELHDSLRTSGNIKREKRAINEAIMNIEQIIYFFNDEGKEAIYPVYEELLALRTEIQRAPSMSSGKRNSLARRVENVKRRFENNFSYSDIEKWIN